MEAAIALGRQPTPPLELAMLAVIQKNDGQLPLAMQSLAEAKARSTDPNEQLMIGLITAGYLIHAGRREEGLREFAAIKDQLPPSEAFIVNIAWFYAVAGDTEQFYSALEVALQKFPQATMRWIDEEVDIKAYKDTDRFRALVAKYAGGG